MDHLLGHRGPGDRPQGIDEAVGGLQAEGHVEDLAGHLVLGVEPAGGIGRTPLAQGQGADGVAGGLQFGHRGAALREHVVLAGQRAVQHAGGVREQDDLDADHGRQPLDLLHVAGLDPAGNDVDLAVLLAGRLGQYRPWP